MASDEEDSLRMLADVQEITGNSTYHNDAYEPEGSTQQAKGNHGSRLRACSMMSEVSPRPHRPTVQGVKEADEQAKNDYPGDEDDDFERVDDMFPSGGDKPQYVEEDT